MPHSALLIYNYVSSLYCVYIICDTLITIVTKYTVLLSFPISSAPSRPPTQPLTSPTTILISLVDLSSGRRGKHETQNIFLDCLWKWFCSSFLLHPFPYNIHICNWYVDNSYMKPLSEYIQSVGASVTLEASHHISVCVLCCVVFPFVFSRGRDFSVTVKGYIGLPSCRKNPPIFCFILSRRELEYLCLCLIMWCEVKRNAHTKRPQNCDVNERVRNQLTSGSN